MRPDMSKYSDSYKQASTDRGEGGEAQVTFYEHGTGIISNGISLRVQFDYNFTEGDEEELNYTQCGILFP